MRSVASIGRRLDRAAEKLAQLPPRIPDPMDSLSPYQRRAVAEYIARTNADQQWQDMMDNIYTPLSRVYASEYTYSMTLDEIQDIYMRMI